MVLKRVKLVLLDLVRAVSPIFVHLLYGDFWNLREVCNRSERHSGFAHILYFAYLEHCESYIGLGANISGPIIFPHGMKGIFISTNAMIGERTVMFQHVTVGSNNLSGERGAPIIESDCYIGAGAKIIGKCRVGHHSRIGANAVVWKDVPENTTVVIGATRYIFHEKQNDNTRW